MTGTAVRAGGSRLLGWGLVGLAAAFLLNQLLVVVYVTAVHGGDPTFVARYLPSGWFELPHGAGWSALARWWPWPRALAGTVLTVQATLELPLVLLAYLLVASWLDPALGRTLARPALLWPASLAWTGTFMAVEWSLRNPWTTADLLARAVSALATPLLLGWGLRRWPPTGVAVARTGVVGLLAYLVSAAALAALVLIGYDTVLLYNLGRLAGDLPATVVAVTVLVAGRATARWAARRPTAAGPGVAVLLAAARWFLGSFFVPALPLRYAMSYTGSRWAVLDVAMLLATAAAVGAASVGRRLAREGSRRLLMWWGAELVTAAAAAVAVAVVVVAVPQRYPELRLLAAAATGAVTLLLVVVAGDRWLRRVESGTASLRSRER